MEDSQMMTTLSEFQTPSNATRFGKAKTRLRWTREFLGFNPEEVALILNMDRSTYCLLKKGT